MSDTERTYIAWAFTSGLTKVPADNPVFVEEYNDKPRLSYDEGLDNWFTNHPPREMVEPMFQSHWSTTDDYLDLEEELETDERE